MYKLRRRRSTLGAPRVSFALATLGVAWLAACAGSEEGGWTVRQAESIRSVRGMPVRVLNCRGLGSGRKRRYARFACIAGARTAGETYDTVGVFYDVVPQENGGYRLENVKFIGGPGVP
jgi:hypothetical protein